jgi:transcriptional regulator with XRE-family HTH domain
MIQPTPGGSPTPGTLFPERVRQSREARGWSKQDLFTALRRVGWPLDRMAVTRTEQGDRKTSIDDLLGFAAALDVAPWYLLLPFGSDEPMRVAGLETTGGAVHAWLIGDAPLPFEGAEVKFLWGTGPYENEVAVLLRGLVKHAEAAETPAELLPIITAGIKALTGLQALVELDASKEGRKEGP